MRCYESGGRYNIDPDCNFSNGVEEFQILIYLTDGYGDIPEKPQYPVMWVITPDGRNSVPWGMEAKMDKF